MICHHSEGIKSVFKLSRQHHHDHIVCLNYDKIIHFIYEIIKQCQLKIAINTMSVWQTTASIFTVNASKIIVKLTIAFIMITTY
ncbi:transcriptional repressor [Candidatus Enterovibrio altilux]|uniref:transcriptional repressor n=1 Tax=Candidatus Enterovibrio altilux TaxID=1927128 RepID=UPI001CC2359C|nr:transcriptional repressor [Candidatus Enterovibrio luxaltus]